ncbi:MAG: hypothetical protein R2786_02350 [Flavobacteriaceae bacterium]
MRKLLFLSIILISCFANAQEEKAKTPKIAIKIEQGQSITLGDVKLKFLTVEEDSRCPKYTNCIWAGRAVVVLEVVEGTQKQEKKVYLGETRPNEPSTKTLYSKDNYFIEVVALNPYPEMDKEKGTYTLLICEGK